MEVADETDTELSIRNIGVLMFVERPEKLIPGAQIDLVKFNTEEAEASDDFVEKTFYGPIWKQVRDVLDYIKTNVLEEKVVKVRGQAEAERYFNYPYNALEEAVVNAVFHKSYKEPEPVEIRIYIDNILSMSSIAQVKKPRHSPLCLRFLTCTLEALSCALVSCYFFTVPY